MITGQLIILLKHWWEGTDAQGNSDVTASTLEPPLGSVPTVKEFVAGRSVVLGASGLLGQGHPDRGRAEQFDGYATVFPRHAPSRARH